MGGKGICRVGMAYITANLSCAVCVSKIGSERKREEQSKEVSRKSVSERNKCPSGRIGNLKNVRKWETGEENRRKERKEKEREIEGEEAD